MRFKKPELIPLLFIICSTLLLGGLGVWQLERLAWKNGLIAAIDNAQAQPPLTDLPADVSMLEYRNVELTGKFANAKAIRRIGGIEGEGPGFFIETPLKLADGRVILVNRGFAPDGKEGTPTGIQTIKGILRPLLKTRPFVPDNQPEHNLWFYEDLPAIEQNTGLTLLPLVVEMTGAHKANVYPIPNDSATVLRNDHLEYAITWFSVMLIGLIMFAFYHRLPDKKS